MSDATCAPSEIKYPQDTELLNDARLHTEAIIDDLCQRAGFKKPRMYRENAGKDYLSIAKKKKKSRKVIRAAIRKQLSYVTQNVGYIEAMQKNGVQLTIDQALKFEKIKQILAQQQFILDSRPLIPPRSL